MWIGLIISGALRVTQLSLFMLYYLLTFFAQARPLLASLTNSYDYSRYREKDPNYPAKKRLVSYAWGIALVAMILVPSPAFAVSTILFVTFLSFMILDEM